MPYAEPFHRLDMQRFFAAKVFSFEEGCLKPETRIFQVGSERLDVPLANILMIGDSVTSDFEGAASAGMRRLLLDRKGRHPTIAPRIITLTEIFDHL